MLSNANETIIQAFRTWAKTLLGLTDMQVVPTQRERKGSPPPAPYMEVSLVPGSSLQIGHDEGASSATQKIRRGLRTGTLSVAGYGAESYDWLVALGLFSDTATGPLQFRRVKAILDLSGIGDDTRGLNEGTIETRYQRDFEMSYFEQVILDIPSTCVQDVVLTLDPFASSTVQMDIQYVVDANGGPVFDNDGNLVII